MLIKIIIKQQDAHLFSHKLNRGDENYTFSAWRIITALASELEVALNKKHDINDTIKLPIIYLELHGL